MRRSLQSRDAAKNNMDNGENRLAFSKRNTEYGDEDAIASQFHCHQFRCRHALPDGPDADAPMCDMLCTQLIAFEQKTTITP
jgi:hypothetical protein